MDHTKAQKSRTIWNRITIRKPVTVIKSIKRIQNSIRRQRQHGIQLESVPNQHHHHQQQHHRVPRAAIQVVVFISQLVIQHRHCYATKYQNVNMINYHRHRYRIIVEAHAAVSAVREAMPALKTVPLVRQQRNWVQIRRKSVPKIAETWPATMIRMWVMDCRPSPTFTPMPWTNIIT